MPFSLTSQDGGDAYPHENAPCRRYDRSAGWGARAAKRTGHSASDRPLCWERGDVTLRAATWRRVKTVKERRTYRVVLDWDADGKGWNVTVPAIPGCFTWSKSVDEAVANAREAVELNLEDMVARGEAIPPPDDVRLETVTVEVPA